MANKYVFDISEVGNSVYSNKNPKILDFFVTNLQEEGRYKEGPTPMATILA
jgi:hypothetical protein